MTSTDHDGHPCSLESLERTGCLYCVCGVLGEEGCEAPFRGGRDHETSGTILGATGGDVYGPLYLNYGNTSSKNKEKGEKISHRNMSKSVNLNTSKMGHLECGSDYYSTGQWWRYWRWQRKWPSPLHSPP